VAALAVAVRIAFAVVLFPNQKCGRG